MYRELLLPHQQSARSGLTRSGFLFCIRMPVSGTTVASLDTVANVFIRRNNVHSIIIYINYAELGHCVTIAIAVLVATALQSDWRNIRVEAAPPGLEALGLPLFIPEVPAWDVSERANKERWRQVGAAIKSWVGIPEVAGTIYPDMSN